MPTSGNGRSSPDMAVGTPVTEVRVHGIGGPTPEDLVDDPRPRQINGDGEAGFFVRRWTGPEEAGAPGRVEGYSWRGMNTSSKAKALWILLAPFALANLAGFMVQTADKGRRRVIEGLVRAAQLPLTLYLVIWLSIAAVDQFAYQCGTNRQCWENRWFAWLFSSDLLASRSRHLVVGAAIVLLALGLLWLVARSPRRYERYGVEPTVTQGDENREQSYGTPLARYDFWGRPDTVRDLLHVHVGASFALLGGVIGYAALHDQHEGHEAVKTLIPVAAVAVVAAAFILLFLWSWYAEREPRPNKKWWSWWAGRLTLVLGSAVLMASATLAWVGPVPAVGRALPGLRWIFVAVVISQVALLLLIGLVCAPRTVLFGVVVIGGMVIAVSFYAAEHDVKFGLFCLFFVAIAAVALVCLSPVVNELVRRRILKRKDSKVEEYRLAPFLMSILAYVVFYGLASALTGRLADVLGDPLPTGLEKPLQKGAVPIRFWHTDEWNGVVWCIGFVLVALTAAVIYGWVLPQRRWNQMPCARVPDDYDVEGVDNDLLTKARKTVCRTGFIVCLYDAVAIAAALATALVLVAYSTDYVATHRAADPARAVSAIVLGAVAAGVVSIIRGSFKQESWRRSLGLIWDLMAFWPRHYHPLAPAVYSERAVPELRDGIARVTATGRTVVSAHSQGTVLAWCALLQSSPEALHRTVLVTHGSPLMKLYATFFPVYFSREAFQRLAGELAPGDPDGRRWTNFYRWTDPVGGALLDRDPAPDDWIYDERNRDPVNLSWDGDPPRIKGHGHYFDDPKVQALIANVRRHLAGEQLVGQR